MNPGLSFQLENDLTIPAVTAAKMREVGRVAMEKMGSNLYRMMENACAGFGGLCAGTGGRWRRNLCGKGIVAIVGQRLGVPRSLAAGSLLEKLLFDVRPADMPTYAVVCGVPGTGGILAGYLPARTASRMNPTSGCRSIEAG